LSVYGRLQRKLFKNSELERKVKTMTEENNVTNWFQDNLRIIISIGIVILLVFAIYSYSQRNSRTDVVVDDSQIEEVAMTEKDGSDEVNEIIDEIKDDQTTETETDIPTAETVEPALTTVPTETEEIIQEEEDRDESQEEMQVKVEEETTQIAEDIVREVIESRSEQKIQQVDGVLTVVAVHGDSMTTLARKAARNYISNNNVEGLTSAHKIYIEDYLRKMHTSRNIQPGTEMSFAQNDIAKAIEHSRALTEAQLNNLSQYAQNVSNL
jgi:hypothetical protein